VVSRSEGYRRGAGKEEGGLVVAEKFFGAHVGVELTRVMDADENYLAGDFRAPSGKSIECKRQPIDPVKYANNFVEVCEETRNPRHEGGGVLLAGLFGITEDQLAAVSVTRRGVRTKFGTPEHLSVSVRSIAGSVLTVYVNPGPPAHLYVYESAALMGAIKGAMRFKGLVRGAGMSNEDTFAVFVPAPAARWTTGFGETSWRLSGPGSEAGLLQRIRQVLA
jgi:hypothetical protein